MEKKSPLVKILSEKKGSNPGGFCTFSDGRNRFDGYLKYCFGSKLPKDSSLKSEHQPIYEAITFELARKLGLKTPGFFVLLNNGNNVEFEDPENVSSNDHSGRNFYFISKKISEPNMSGLGDIGDEIIEKERIYLDSLMISDILGRRQNYMIIPQNHGFGVFYLDLGCSFVHATNGFIRLPNDLKKYSLSNSKKRDRCNIKDKTIIGADNEMLVNLEELIYSFGGLTIPTLNPFSRIPVSDLISSKEVSEIANYIVHGLCKSLHGYKEKGLLV